MIEKAIECLNVNVERIIITILRQHCNEYDAELVCEQSLLDKDVEICILEKETQSQCHTLYETIRKMNVRGAFVSKDSDGYINVDIEKEDNSFIVGVQSKNYPYMTNMANKSFIILNDNGIVIDVIEKNICSNIISIGMYGFQSAKEFMKIYKRIYKSGNYDGEIYPSHVISYLLSKGHYFKYIEAREYEDWGTLSDWNRVRNRMKTLFIDIDGVIFRNRGNYGSKTWWNSEDEPISKNVEILKKLQKEGAQIIFCTARPETGREVTVLSLSRIDIKYHTLIMGCHHSKRVIINDYSHTNPFPVCESINISRDSEDLDMRLRGDY